MLVGVALAAIGATVTCTLAAAVPRYAHADEETGPPPRAPIDPWLARLHRGPETGDAARLLAWVEEMVSAGRARAGTETGALLVAGAASELARRGGAPSRALVLLEEALRGFRPDDPRSGLLWLDVADVRNDLGDPPRVLEALERADAVASRPGPRDEPYPGPPLRARLLDELASRGEGLRRHALSAVGRHAEAASLWERGAAAPAGAAGSEGAPGSDDAWEWAAEEAWAAGDPARALRDIDLAIASARGGSSVVARVAWRIRAAFGQLTERGDVAYRPARITDELFTAWRAALRDHGARPGGFQLALDAATFALAGGRTEELLEFFTFAFTSPGFASEAAQSRSRRMEIVAAARMALAADRPAQALAWFRLAEHHEGGPLPHTEGLRLAIEDALRPTDAPGSEPSAVAPLALEAAVGGAPPRGLLPGRPLPAGDAALAAEEPAPYAPPTPTGSADAPDGSFAPLAWGGAAALAGAMLLLYRGRPARGRARVPGSTGNGC